VKHEWGNTGRGEGLEEEEEGDWHPPQLSEVPSNFSAVFAPMLTRDHSCVRDHFLVQYVARTKISLAKQRTSFLIT